MVVELWADIELCVIITACTDPHSYEVRISRKYRDQFMSESQLRGYYMMAERSSRTLKVSVGEEIRQEMVG